MFHRTRDAIEAHLTIVFTALAVAHCIQERSGRAIANVIKQLRPLRSATIVINGASQAFPPERSCPCGGVKGVGRRFPRRPASLKEGAHVRVEEGIACAAVAGGD